MKISARNTLKGTIVEIKEGEVMAEVVLDVNGQRIISVVTKDAIEELGLKRVEQRRQSLNPPKSCSW